MSKRDLERRIDRQSPVVSGEMVAVASVTQVQHLTISGPYSGDFQIVDNGRLIVGNDPDIGNRGIISPYGIFGYNNNGVNVFSVWFKPAQNGGWTSGDVHAGNLAANYMLYDQSEGTFGLYTPAGSGVLLKRDGGTRFGHPDGAHMDWDSADGNLRLLSGSVVTVDIDAQSGNAEFTGVMTATGGRITGDMQVDARLRAGDVDGPAVYIGKLTDEDGAAYAGQIMVTDTENVPWFNVRTGSDGTGYLHVGRPGDYANRLTLEVTETTSSLTFDGTAYLRGGAVTGDMTIEGDLTVTSGSITAGGGDVVIGDDGIRLDATTGKFTDASIEWWDAGVNRLSIGTSVDLGAAVAGYIEAVDIALELTGNAITLEPGSGRVTVSDDVVIISTAKTPASAAATGSAGMIAWDTGYIYVCTATNTWKRATIAAW